MAPAVERREIPWRITLGHLGKPTVYQSATGPTKGWIKPLTDREAALKALESMIAHGKVEISAVHEYDIPRVDRVYKRVCDVLNGFKVKFVTNGPTDVHESPNTMKRWVLIEKKSPRNSKE